MAEYYSFLALWPAPSSPGHWPVRRYVFCLPVALGPAAGSQPAVEWQLAASATRPSRAGAGAASKRGGAAAAPRRR